MDRTIILDQHDRLDHLARFGAIEPIQLLKISDEAGAPLGRAVVNDQLTRAVVERSQDRHFLGLARCGHPQVGTGFRPGSGQIGMGERFAFVAIQQNDIAGSSLLFASLLFASLQAQADTFHFAGDLASFQGVPGPPPAEVFFASPWIIATG